ncbi:MAG: DUF3422 domain-containing protein [Magnetospirillum sp.]|nr:DUF3422 domain-containing protein [Magnetospirillum sp.]
MVPLNEHPLRRMLAGEVHARPYEVLGAPVRMSHLAVIHREGGDSEAERTHLAQLLGQHGAEPPGEGTNYFSRDLGALRLRFERHAEFSTYTFFRFDDFDHPFFGTALELVPQAWLHHLPGDVVTAVHLAVERTERPADAIAPLFDGNPMVGSEMAGGAAQIWTDFRLHADGFGRILVRDVTLTGGQTGRLAQRLLEIETYRLMALLAFPLARQSNGEVARIERDIAGIIAELADPAVCQNDRALLDRLTGMAAEAERLDATTAFRLSAARAYHAIVQQRIAELREERITGLQTVSEFMDRRLAPAMKTCETATDRQRMLAGRISRTSGLLRTRVDIALEEKNGDLLKSMNRRAKLQLRLQETVEGLSVVAISYYLLGLVSYAAKGLKAVGAPVSPDLAAIVGLPIILGAVTLALRRLRRALGQGHREE